LIGTESGLKFHGDTCVAANTEWVFWVIHSLLWTAMWKIWYEVS